MKSLRVKIADPVGMHARPAAVLVKKAVQFKSDIEIEYNNTKVNAKSIMGLMSLGIPTGAEVQIHIDGEDEDTAYNELLGTLKDENIVA